MDDKYNEPKDYFSVSLKKTMCKSYMQDNNIDPETVVSARDFCQEVM